MNKYQQLEAILNKCIEKGWKPRGIEVLKLGCTDYRGLTPFTYIINV